MRLRQAGCLWHLAIMPARDHEPSLPAGRALTLVAIVAGLGLWHIRRPQVHALEGAIFVGLLAIVWLGVSRAH